jgi:raffinose synthase
MVGAVSPSHSKRIQALATVATPSRKREVPFPPLALWLQDGGLEVGAGADPIAAMKPRLAFSDGDDTPHTLVPVGRAEKGRDGAGAFEIHRFRLVPEVDPLRARTARPIKATLNLKRYLADDVIVGTLDYRGPPLAPEGGLRFGMRFDDLSEALAMHQFKLHWIAPTTVSTERNLPAENLGLLWRQMNNDRYHLFVPLGGNGMSGEIGAARSHGLYEVRLSHSSRAPDHAPKGEVPLFVFAADRDPYALPERAWRAAFASTRLDGALREDKPPPNVFTDHLGYCTWEALHTDDCTEANIVESVKWYRDRGVPIGLVIIDDGMQQVTADRRLFSFEADPKRFPNGLASTVSELKALGVEDVAVWMAKDGYWRGVDPSAGLGPLAPAKDGVFVPELEFYRAYFGFLKRAGVTAVKVDNQSMTEVAFEGLKPAQDVGARAHAMIAKAASEAGLTVMDCMSQRQFNLLNSRSNVIRASDDYLPGSSASSKEQLLHLFKNAYFLNPLFHLDGDMFQSHDPRALPHIYARIMLDTFYVSDETGKAKVEHLLPALDDSGRRIKLSSPAQPTEDCLIADPSLNRMPLKVFGRADRAAMVAAFNVDKSADRIEGTVSAGDVPHLRGKRVAIHARNTGRTHALEPNQAHRFHLDEFGGELFTLAPIDHGAAVLGLLDKYFGPAAVSHSRKKDVLTIDLSSSGTLGVWMEYDPKEVRVDGEAAKYSFRGHVLRLEAKAGQKVEIR